MTSYKIYIDKLVLRELALPLKSPFLSGAGTISTRRILLIELWDREGCVGWGECVALDTPGYLPETIDTAWVALVEWLVPCAIGKSFGGPADIYTALRAEVRGHNMALAAIEMAAWDLAARQRSVSLATMLGGTRDEVSTGIALGFQDSIDALLDQAEEALAAGYARLRVKIGPGKDTALLEPLRARLGPDAALMADANGAYTLGDAELLRSLDVFALEMLEQPLPWDDLVRHATLQPQLSTPICLDESLTGPDRVGDMIALGAGRIVNLKPGRVGGFVPSLVIHDLCKAHGIPMWCGGMLESGIGRAHNVALASLPGFTLPGDLSPSARYWSRDIVDPEWTMDAQGMVRVPRTDPGIGVALDLERIEALTTRKQEFRAE